MDILINSLPALLAVIVTFLLTQYSNFAKQRKFKKAMRLIFYGQFTIFAKQYPIMHPTKIFNACICMISIFLSPFCLSLSVIDILTVIFIYVNILFT